MRGHIHIGKIKNNLAFENSIAMSHFPLFFFVFLLPLTERQAHRYHILILENVLTVKLHVVCM